MTVRLLLSMLGLALLMRALVSLFMPEDESLFGGILMAVTEPFLMPLRVFLSRFSFFNETPIDVSFFVLVVLVSVLNMFLPIPVL